LPIRLQPGIVLGYGQERLQTTGEGILRTGLERGISRRQTLAPGPGNLGQNLLLISPVLPNNPDQIGNQIVAPLQLDIDPAPPFFDKVLPASLTRFFQRINRL